MRCASRGHFFTVTVAATVATVGLAACGTSPAPGGSPLASVPASAVTGSPSSVLPVTSGSATAVKGSPIADLPTAGTTSPGPPVTGRTLLTEADSEITIVLPAGHEVTVVLGPPGAAMPWDQPVAQGGAVARVSASGGYPSSLAARAVFTAVRPGTARLTSVTDAKCLHLPAATRCLPPQRIWEVTVVVPAS
jgi:hypothetical protein